jgi:hypothetical protein
MKIELDTKGLQTLVKGSQLYYDEFNHPLILKSGHAYSDQYGRTSWHNLDNLTDAELYEVYLICKKSFEKRNS